MSSRLSKKKYLYPLLLPAGLIVLAYLLATTAWPGGQLHPVKNKTLSVTTSSTLTQVTTVPVILTATTTAVKPVTPKIVPIPTFKTLTLTAKTAIVYDLATDQTLYSKYAAERRPIASLTKVMTAYAAALVLAPETAITITDIDANLESSAGIIAGERWKLSDLTAFMLVSSSNGGAQAIARTVAETSGQDFVEKMNQLAQELGLLDSYFRNPTGLDLYDSQLSGSYSTARDVAKLFAHLYEYDPQVLADTNKYRLTVYTLDNIRHDATNTNWLVAQIPNVISSKTGLTNLAGGNLAMIVRPVAGHPVVLVVLGSTSQGRFTDAEKLIQATKEELAK